MTNEKLAYTILKISMGTSFFLHGAVRLPDLSGFANGVAQRFNETILGGFPALSMGYIIPVAEAAAGLLILAGGKYIRWGAAGGGIIMGVLMIGTCILQKWEWMPSQLIHLIIFYLILMNPSTQGPSKTSIT